MHVLAAGCIIMGLLFSSSVFATSTTSLIDEAKSLAGTDPRKALHLLSLIENLAAKNDALLLAEKDLLKCEILVDNDDPKEALKSTSPYLGHASLPPNVLMNLELCHFSALEASGQATKAMEGLTYLLEKSRKLNLPAQQGKAHLNMGQLLSYQNQFSESLKHLLQAKEIFKKLQDSNEERITLNSIAVLYGRMGEHERALEYFAEVLQKNRDLNKTRNVAVVLYNMGRRYEDLNQFEKSREHFTESLKIHRELGNTKSIAVVERALGSLYNSMNQPLKALEHLKTAVTTLEGMNLPKSLGQLYFELGRTYAKLGDNKQALLNLKKAHGLNSNPNSVQLAADIFSEESRIYQSSGQWKQAYTALEGFKKYSDQMHLIRADEQLRQLNFKFDLSKKEEANRILKAQNQSQERQLKDAHRIQRLQLMSLSLVVLLLSVTAIFTIRQVRTARRMRELAMTDELTRIPNRRHVLEYGAQSLSTSQRQGKGMSVIIFDIDHFKRINDTFGHAVGDEVIKRVADIGKKALRKGDMIGRIGGEEFLSILPFTDPLPAKEVAERIRREISLCDFTDLAPNLTVTVSAGVSCYTATDKQSSIDSLIQQADEALYSVKQNGRNGVSLRLVS